MRFSPLKQICTSICVFVALATTGIANEIAGTSSVIDGDTIEIHGKRIRFHAIDAPESRQFCTRPNGTKWRCGAASANALSDKIGRAPLRCEITDIDRYDRYVARCYLGSEDLNAWLVTNGWAVAYRRYGLDYVDQEEIAAATQSGIWATAFEMPWTWRRNN